MWVGGPPNPVQPMRPHARSTVIRDGGGAAATAAGPGGSTG
jgi:hypothetical protein